VGVHPVSMSSAKPCQLAAIAIVSTFTITHSILGISWHQFVWNEKNAARTGLPPLLTAICCRRSTIFGHLVRLGNEVPAHKALYICVTLSQGRLPDPTWKRPRGRWINQLRRDNNRPPADQWKLAIKRGHGGRATLRSHDYATT